MDEVRERCLLLTPDLPHLVETRGDDGRARSRDRQDARQASPFAAYDVATA